MPPLPESTPPLLPSVLDRLIDLEPTSNVEAPPYPPAVLREIRQSVRRDLENLLNTRRLYDQPARDDDPLAQSSVGYGIPDFTGAAADLHAMLAAIEDAIRRFEPRLKNVRVLMDGPGQAIDRTLRFRIEATLWVEPLTEPVAFRSKWESTTSSMQVEGDAA
jgi:type VI secretion system protein ImpF